MHIPVRQCHLNFPGKSFFVVQSPTVREGTTNEYHIATNITCRRARRTSRSRTGFKNCNGVWRFAQESKALFCSRPVIPAEALILHSYPGLDGGGRRTRHGRDSGKSDHEFG